MWVAFASFHKGFRKVAFLWLFQLIAFTWFLAHLYFSHMSRSFEEIALFFLMNSLLCILCSIPLVIHGARFLLILFRLRGACLSMQLATICFHSCHMSFGSEHRSTFDHGICSRPLKNLLFFKCLNCLI